MRTITRASLALVGAAALTLAIAVPANAADDVTVTVEAGTIGISTAETDLALADSAPGDVVDGNIAGVLVEDARAGVTPWVASASITAFTAAPTNAAATASLAAAAVNYTPQAITATGAPTITATPGAGFDLATAVASPVVTTTAVNGNNTAGWDATLEVTLPDDALAATYTAIITHSVA